MYNRAIATACILFDDLGTNRLTVSLSWSVSKDGIVVRSSSFTDAFTNTYLFQLA